MGERTEIIRYCEKKVGIRENPGSYSTRDENVPKAIPKCLPSWPLYSANDCSVNDLLPRTQSTERKPNVIVPFGTANRPRDDDGFHDSRRVVVVVDLYYSYYDHRDDDDGGVVVVDDGNSDHCCSHYCLKT